MADEPHNLILDHLRAIRATVERTSSDVTELKTRAGRLEKNVAELHVTLAEHSVRMDKIDARLDRIEKRLELAETSI
jgi:uncharacterized coiled-coil protein SlyX